jgi:hypothetical protein
LQSVAIFIVWELNRLDYSVTSGSAQFRFAEIIAMRGDGFLIAAVIVHNEDSA